MMLTKLPRRVMADLRKEVAIPLFQKHPFFEMYMMHNPTGHIYIYISLSLSLFLSLYVYIYIYMI